MKIHLKMLLLVITALMVVTPYIGCNSGSGGGGEETATITEPSPEIVSGVASSSSDATGFLWKPVSESDGNLVILFPSALRGLITSGAVYSAWPFTPENLVEEGRFTGDTHNGNRPHYRFSGSGASFGNNLFAVATKNDGSQDWWYIPEGAQRTEM